MANANSNYDNCYYYHINSETRANVNWGPDPPTAGAIINVNYSISGLSMPTTHLVYMVASIVRDDKNTDPIVGSKVKVDRNVKDISVSTSLKWPSPADKKNRYSLVVFLLDYNMEYLLV
ncbi:8321_t:CDS:1 [Gigaspora margarita]|uniref:8321_t:CDS:1 n=1 Tax=Gigaspora margarita TaxID=4874 RepID=A0ABM8VZX7_GIGMA|nr:8321_t:CDS:1 [Gigaspora margarita]